MREKIIELIKNAGLKKVEAELINSLQRSIRISANAAIETELKVGCSKFGGCPDLPSEIKWPRNKNGSPLTFLAQFRLEDVVPYDVDKLLPTKGMLFFFYEVDDQVWGFDPEDRSNWKVIYYNGNGSLIHTDAPDDLSGESVFNTCSLQFNHDVTLPPWESIFIEKLNLNKEEQDAYFDLCERVLEIKDDDEVINRLLGYPDQVQGEMQLECQLVSNGLYCGDSTGYQDPRRKKLEAGAANWRLLFQLDSVEDAGMMWGDVGRLYFWIEENALKECDFEKVWMVLQCG